jgi:F-type H+-transporting ATPase subunit b
MQILNNFGIQPILLLAQIVNFLIIVYLLKKFFYKPIVKMLDDRKKTIEESLKNAQTIEEKLQKTEEKSALLLEEARKNAQDLISQAKIEAERIATQAAQEARSATEDALNRAMIQMESQKEAMRKSLQEETMNLVVEVTKKVLGRNLKDQERRQLTQKSMSEIKGQIQ